VSDVRSNSELTEATASGLRWITIARVGTELVLLASMVLLARLIPPAAFGMFALAVIVQELAIAVPSEGVGSALVQRRSIEREHLQGGLALSLAIGAVLAVASLLLAVFVVHPVFGDETASLVMMTTPFFLVGAISALPLAVLRRRLDFRLLSILELTQSMVRSLSSVALAMVGLDAPALMFGALIGMTSLLVIALIVAPVPLPRWRPRAIRELLPYGGPAAIAAVAWAGFRNADYAIVGARLGAAQAGFYWRGYQLAVEYQRKVTAVMTQMGFPVLARTEGMDEMLALRGRMVRLLTVMLFPALVLLVLLAPTLVPWLFGPAWEPAVLPTQILAGAGAACLVIDQVGAVLMAAGRARALLGYGVAHFIAYAGAVFVAAGHGLAAVATAAFVVHGIFVWVAYDLMLRGRPERPLRLLWDDIAAATVACLALVVTALPVEIALREAGAPPLLHIVTVSAVAAAAYLVALRLGFPDCARDLAAVARRILPMQALRAAARRIPLRRPLRARTLIPHEHTERP
jgi:lipopolysaccharide exporter